MLTGYLAKEEKAWNRTRNLMSYIVSYGGMGTSEFVTPESIWPLPMDEEDQKKMIKTLAQAKVLINDFEKAINGKVRS